MSEIPYFFETPIPKYFRETGWFNNEKTWKFVTWSFSKCSSRSHKIVFDGKEITLQPFEFIAGRKSSSTECFLTEKEFRGQLFSMIDAGILKKGANSKANRFTTYIWLTDRFCKIEGQQKGQPRANQGPTKGHNLDIKNKRIKEGLPSNLPSSKSKRVREDKLTEDPHISPKIEIYPGILLAQSELDACIALKGSLEKVKFAIEHVMRAPGRKYTIANWPETLAKWEIKDSVVHRIIENKNYAIRLEKLHEDNTGWKCQYHRDNKKDQDGILFYNCTPTGNSEPIFISVDDYDFRNKALKVLVAKKMQRGRMAESL